MSPSARDEGARHRTWPRKLPARRRGPVRQPGNDRASGENLRIGCQHDGCHRAAGGKAGHEDAAAVDAEFSTAFATIWRMDSASPLSRAVSPGKNHEKQFFGLFAACCSGKMRMKPKTIGKIGPARSLVIRVCCLGAAMQSDDERRGRADASGT